MSNRSRFAGWFNALDFAYGCFPNSPPALKVDIGNSATGAGTLTLATGQTQLTDGTILYPLATSAPITVGIGANAETVTPSAVGNPTIPGYDQSTVTATYSNLHGIGDAITSGSMGLMEAINYAVAQGGGVVVVDARWVAMGGTAAQWAAAVAALPTTGKVILLDNRTPDSSIGEFIFNITSAQIKTLNSVGVDLLPAPGAGNMWLVSQVFAENIYGTAAYTSGGAIQLSYGTGTTTPASATIAATFLTSPTANEVIMAAGALAAALASATVNAKLRLACATADFATGDGTIRLKVSARLITGLA